MPYLALFFFRARRYASHYVRTIKTRYFAAFRFSSKTVYGSRTTRNHSSRLCILRLRQQKRPTIGQFDVQTGSGYFICFWFCFRHSFRRSVLVRRLIFAAKWVCLTSLHRKTIIGPKWFSPEPNYSHSDAVSTNILIVRRFSPPNGLVILTAFLLARETRSTQNISSGYYYCI